MALLVRNHLAVCYFNRLARPLATRSIYRKKYCWMEREAGITTHVRYSFFNTFRLVSVHADM